MSERAAIVAGLEVALEGLRAADADILLRAAELEVEGDFETAARLLVVHDRMMQAEWTTAHALKLLEAVDGAGEA